MIFFPHLDQCIITREIIENVKKTILFGNVKEKDNKKQQQNISESTPKVHGV